MATGENVGRLGPTSNLSSATVLSPGGGTARTLAERFGDAVSVLDFIPKAMHAAIRAGTSTDNVHAYIMEAINSQTYGTGYYISGPAVYFPPGTYLSNSTIELKRATRLFGDAGVGTDAPGATLKWPAGVPGIIVHRYNTIGSGKEAAPTTAGDRTVIENLRVLGAGGATANGIWLRTRAVLRNVHVRGWSGNGIQVVAVAGSADPAVEGNANVFRIEGGRIQNCTGHGLYVEGSDANAGLVIGLDSSANGGWGIFDSSFLGNTYLGCHTNGNALGPYKTDSNNAANVFVGCYAESGQASGSDLVAPTLVIGGMHAAGFTSASTHAQLGSNDAKALTTALTAIRDRAGVTFKTNLNDGSTGDEVLGIWRSDVSSSWPWRLKMQSDGGLVLDFANSSNNQAFAVTGVTTTSTFGRASAVPYALYVPRLHVGQSGTVARRVTYNTAAPTSGEWARGDIIFNTNASAGGKVGWVCTTGGTAGVDAVFKPFGVIDP